MGDSRICGYITHGFSSPPTDHYKSKFNSNSNRSSVIPSTFFSKSSFALSNRSGMLDCKPTYGSLIGNNIREVRNWSVGELPGPIPIIACTSTRTIISRQLKTDAIPTEDGQLQQTKKEKRKRMSGGMCVYV